MAANEKDVGSGHEGLIGTRLNHFRKAQGMTLEMCAERCGFTKGYLSKIENGRKVPPVASLMSIARALEITLADLLHEPDAPVKSRPVCVVRADERRSVVRGGSTFGYDYESLAGDKHDKHMEPFIFTWPTELASEVRFEHEGEEFIFLLSGTVEMHIDEERHVLRAGDCIYFDSSLPHRGRSIGGRATSLVVIYKAERQQSV